MWFFTGDQHYFHSAIIKYTNRPFESVEDMNEELVERFNSKVSKEDITVHAGDFSFGTKQQTTEIIKQLNGNHIFIRGCHDHWMSTGKYLWQKKIDDCYVVACHYPMRSWPRSFHGSIQLHAHVHGRLLPLPNQLDVGVDCWDYYPVSFDEVIKNILKKENYYGEDSNS